MRILLYFLTYGILGLMLLTIIFSIVWVVYRQTIFQPAQKTTSKQKKSKRGQLPEDAGVRDLVAAGRIGEAIDLYQRFAGVDEFTAHDAIEDMQREMRLSNIPEEVVRLAHEGEKARAIETYQALTGADLDEALTVVESVESTHKTEG